MDFSGAGTHSVADKQGRCARAPSPPANSSPTSSSQNKKGGRSVSPLGGGTCYLPGYNYKVGSRDSDVLGGQRLGLLGVYMKNRNTRANATSLQGSIDFPIAKERARPSLHGGVLASFSPFRVLESRDRPEPEPPEPPKGYWLHPRRSLDGHSKKVSSQN